MERIIEMKNITKIFPGVKAVDNGQFDLKQGEIHALVGENGAGKSTMMKILYGLYAPDEGIITVKGQEYDALTTRDAIDLGIGMVHQEFMLVEEMTVLENIILGFEPRKSRNRIDFKKAIDKIEYYVKNYSLDIQVNKKVREVSVGEAQRVEIIKTLYRGADILILDEPTSVLTPQETEKLFEILKYLRDDNKSIIFISHKLNEVMEISDRITVMRHGKYVGTVNTKNTTIPEIAKMMVGREVFLNIERKKSEIGEILLSVEDIYVPGERELSKIKGISFKLHKGEILGVAGVDGNGQTEIVEAITGLRKVEKGDIIFKGASIKNLSPGKIRKLGISHIPEDRNKKGLNRSFTIKENLIADKFQDKEFSNWKVLNEKKIREFAEVLVKKFDIRPADVNLSAEHLSGGNAQKIVIAREASNGSDLIIAHHPTRGLDIGSMEFIRKVLNDIKEKGVGILLISADLQEILSLSDRILVLYEGRITGILNNEEATEENLGLLMTGGHVNEEVRLY